MKPKVIVKDLYKEYQSEQGTVVALEQINLEIHQGEFLSILGPSGCGKSTLLRIMAGLNHHSAGEIIVTRSAKSNKPLNAMVFQDYALFPWRNVLDNVAFGLEMQEINKKERQKIALTYLQKVGLQDFAKSYPHQLSGGMKQRVSIARAFATDPEILLMDEPLGALDAQTRNILQLELMKIWEETKKTVIYITHSIEEAIIMGDRIVVMTARPGKIKEIIPVNIPRPRGIELRESEIFASYYGQIWRSLKDEVEKSMTEVKAL